MLHETTFQPFSEILEKDRAPALLRATFAKQMERLLQGETGMIAEEAITPVESLPRLEALPLAPESKIDAALAATVVIKLNGGLGTGMGLRGPKSLLKVKGRYSFLDILALQAIQAQTPLILMDSFSTQAASLRALRSYHLPQRGLPLDFLQHRIPKILADSLRPASSPDQPELAWCPPGHGDIYTAFLTTGLLDRMLEAGVLYAFVSNADNLGALLDRRLLGYLATHPIPFLMEVTERTDADKKGGHLARSLEGQLLLREAAQCPTDQQDAFQDIRRYRFFNTNNLWLHLPSLRSLLLRHDGILPLPLIRNQKPLNPCDASSPLVYQLETAMGSALSVIPHAQAICVPRDRFAPVKSTNDLFALRSDAYVLDEKMRLLLSPEGLGTPPLIDLDPRYYRMIQDLDRRFPFGPPSLLSCRSFRVLGDIRFAKAVLCTGDVSLQNPLPAPALIPAHAHLTGSVLCSESDLEDRNV